MNDITEGPTRESEDGTVMPVPDPRLASTDMHGTMDTVEADPFFVTDLVDEAKVSREDLLAHPEPYRFTDEDSTEAPDEAPAEGESSASNQPSTD